MLNSAMLSDEDDFATASGRAYYDNAAHAHERVRSSSSAQYGFTASNSPAVASDADAEEEHGVVDGANSVLVPDFGDDDSPAKFSWRLLWAYTGPGWLMSIAYLDPGNLESDLQAGAYAGYQLIWVLFWSTVLGLVLQILAARLGVVTGKHLAQVCRENYSPAMAKMLWLMTELAIIGSDIQQVIGSAIAFKILFGLPLWAGVLITGADTFTFMLLHAFGVRKLEALFAVLIGTMSICFFVNFGFVHPSGVGMARGMVPDISDYAVVEAVSIIGAVVMPHNIFLHSALVQSRAVDRTRPAKVREANFYFSIEAAVALGVSFVINLAVVAVFAKGFFDPTCAKQGLALVEQPDGSYECDDIGLQGAGAALKSLLGDHASTIWAIGLLAAGQSSTMTGTFAGQYVMEGFLTMQLAPWKRVAFTRGIALIPAVLVAIFGARSSHTSDVLDEYLNILQSVQLPFALLPILHFTSSKRIMGEAFVNGSKFRAFGWCISLGVIAVNFYLVATQILDFKVSGLPETWWMYLILAIIVFAYWVILVFIIWNDVTFGIAWIRRRLGMSSSGSTEELEADYDQPEKLSPAWLAMHPEEVLGSDESSLPDDTSSANYVQLKQGSSAGGVQEPPRL